MFTSAGNYWEFGASGFLFGDSFYSSALFSHPCLCWHSPVPLRAPGCHSLLQCFMKMFNLFGISLLLKLTLSRCSVTLFNLIIISRFLNPRPWFEQFQSFVSLNMLQRFFHIPVAFPGVSKHLQILQRAFLIRDDWHSLPCKATLLRYLMAQAHFPCDSPPWFFICSHFPLWPTSRAVAVTVP